MKRPSRSPRRALETAFQRYTAAIDTGHVPQYVRATWALYRAHGCPLGRTMKGLALWMELETWVTRN